MASSYYKLEISNRIDIGTKGAKKERRRGLVPGVLYYSGEEAINISIKKSNLLRAMNSGQRIFEIDQSGKSQFTMIKQIQYHPVSDEIIHVDLMRVRRSEKISISVPIVLVGESVGVKDILAKSKGSSNPHNVVKATMDALLQLRDARTVATQRGISMSKVFNAK